MSKEGVGATQSDTVPGGSRGELSYHRIVWNLAWPAIALNTLQSANSLLDRKFLDLVGPSALAASGAAFSFVFLLFALAMALGTGATALVSRFYGADENLNMVKATRQSISLGVAVGTVAGAFAWFAAPWVASAFLDAAKDPLAYQYAIDYLRPVAIAMPALYTFNTLASCLRAVGDTKTPMYVSGAQILLHIALNFLLIFPTREVSMFGSSFTMPGFGLGVAGSGISFAISAWFAMLVYFIVSDRTILGKSWKLQVIEAFWAARLTKIALPAAGQNMIRVGSMVLFMLALRHTDESSDALGAMSISLAIESIAFMPVFGFMIAASALVGQSLGMKDPTRAERLAWAATNQGVLLMVGMGLVLFFFADPLSSVFVSDPDQRYLVMRFLQIIAITEPLFGYAMVLTGAHQGAGDTVRPTWVALISNIGIRVVFVWVFAVWMGLNTIAAWWVMSFSQAVQGLLMIYIFKQGRWKEQKV